MPASATRAATLEIAWNPEKKQQVASKALKAYRKHGTWGKAASVAGIDRRTLKEWVQKDPILGYQFADADADVTDDLEEGAIKQAKKGDGRVLIHLLASRNKRYAHKTEVHVVQQLNLDNVMEKMRQICVAQPTLAPFIESALVQCLDRIRDGRTLEHVK
jgi:hypothetical protein